MQKITKKHFKQLHTSGKLKLLSGLQQLNKDQILERLEAYKGNIAELSIDTTGIPNTGDDLQNGYSTKIYKSGKFIIIEDIIDNDKNQYISSNELEVWSMSYILIEV